MKFIACTAHKHLPLYRWLQGFHSPLSSSVHSNVRNKCCPSSSYALHLKRKCLSFSISPHIQTIHTLSTSFSCGFFHLPVSILSLLLPVLSAVNKYLPLLHFSDTKYGSNTNFVLKVL